MIECCLMKKYTLRIAVADYRKKSNYCLLELSLFNRPFKKINNDQTELLETIRTNYGTFNKFLTYEACGAVSVGKHLLKKAFLKEKYWTPEVFRIKKIIICKHNVWLVNQ